MWNCLRSVETLLKDIVQGKTSSTEMNQHLSLEDKECERLCNPNSGRHSTGAPEIQSEGSGPKADDGEVLLLSSTFKTTAFSLPVPPADSALKALLDSYYTLDIYMSCVLRVLQLCTIYPKYMVYVYIYVLHSMGLATVYTC